MTPAVLPPDARLAVRPVGAAEHRRLRELRLAALAADPDAFGATHESEAAEPPDWWQAWASESEAGTSERTFVLVDDDERWWGMALVHLVAGCELAELNAMWVSPAARGRGSASVLADACATWASHRGARCLRLHVVQTNEPARRAYEKSGFVPAGTRSVDRHGRRFDELVMIRDL